MIVKTRRTQEERREETTRKLLDAASEVLIELGYAGASVQKVCERAGVSQGGLFRHYPTREALMVAVGEDVGQKLLADYKKKFEALRGASDDPLGLAMRLVRDQCRSRLNQAWYELAIACRTSPGLRKALQPAALRYYADVEVLARELLPELAREMGETFPVLVTTILAVFDGEVVHRFIMKAPQLEDARFELLRKALAPGVKAD
jgi:AcrR family transcriptional regulator